MRGRNPPGLIGGGNKRLIAKNHSKKNDQRTWDKAREILYPTALEQSTDGKDIHKIDTLIASPSRSKQQTQEMIRARRATMPPTRSSSPSSDTNSGAGKREERDSGTRDEPQPVGASRENGLIPPRPTTRASGKQGGAELRLCRFCDAVKLYI